MEYALPAGGGPREPQAEARPAALARCGPLPQEGGTAAGPVRFPRLVSRGLGCRKEGYGRAERAGVGRAAHAALGSLPTLFCLFKNLFQIILGPRSNFGRNRIVKHGALSRASRGNAH